MKKYSNIPPSCPVLAKDKYEFKDFTIDPEVLPEEMPMKHMMVKTNVTGAKGEIVSTRVKHPCDLEFCLSNKIIHNFLFSIFHFQ